MRKIETGVAPSDLARLVEDIAGGEGIVLAMDGEPVARLVAFEPRPRPREPGLMNGRISIAADFAEPLPEESMAAFLGERP